MKLRRRKSPLDSKELISFFPQLSGTGSGQVITTYDPRLNALGLPQYPPLPSTLDAAKVEEIRRTVYIGNLDPKTVSRHVVLRLRQWVDMWC